jgi:hypothetical protein
MRVEKDYRDFLKLLGAKKAKYLIVGGYAYSYHAEPRYTKDIDSNAADLSPKKMRPNT